MIDMTLPVEVAMVLKQLEMRVYRHENHWRVGITQPTADEWREMATWLRDVLMKCQPLLDAAEQRETLTAENARLTRELSEVGKMWSATTDGHVEELRTLKAALTEARTVARSGLVVNDNGYVKCDACHAGWHQIDDPKHHDDCPIARWDAEEQVSTPPSGGRRTP